MAPRQRKSTNRGLPPNTRCRDGYYSWRHPETKAEYGLGRDRTVALKEAIRANALLAAKAPSLIDRITGAADTLGDWLDTYEKLLEKRKGRDGKPLAANTARTYASHLKHARRLLDVHKSIADVSTLDVSNAIDALVDEGKDRMAQAFRSVLHDSFRVAIQKGRRKDNPVEVTDRVSVQVQRARLSFDVLMQVYTTTENIRLKNAIALALVSGQARESICAVKFSDIRDGGWWNERGKTGARIIIPLELRLDCFGMSLADVVKQCRTTGVLSPYLIHQAERGAWKRPGAHTHVNQLTREFTDAVAALKLDWGDKRAPTFHEIRSLSSRLYKAQGNVNPQELLGHRDPRTTAVYTDGRGEWVRVAVRS